MVRWMSLKIPRTYGPNKICQKAILYYRSYSGHCIHRKRLWSLTLLKRCENLKKLTIFTIEKSTFLWWLRRVTWYVCNISITIVAIPSNCKNGSSWSSRWYLETAWIRKHWNIYFQGVFNFPWLTIFSMIQSCLRSLERTSYRLLHCISCINFCVISYLSGIFTSTIG